VAQKSLKPTSKGQVKRKKGRKLRHHFSKASLRTEGKPLNKKDDAVFAKTVFATAAAQIENCARSATYSAAPERGRPDRVDTSSTRRNELLLFTARRQKKAGVRSAGEKKDTIGRWCEASGGKGLSRRLSGDIAESIEKKSGSRSRKRKA